MVVRVIPRLDIKGPNLVKGMHLEGLRVLGKPERFAKHYYDTGADELIYMDTVASLYQRNSLLDIVERTASHVFIPLTVGGGLRKIEDIRAVLRAGADKVAINTAAIQNPDLVREASRLFGSSTIVISIEAIGQPDGTYEAFTDCGRESTGVDALEWAVEAERLGAGELLVTSINQEGTGKGYDLNLTRQISEAVSIPVIAAGGAGSLDHVCNVVGEGKADAVCVASILHYGSLDACTGDDDSFAEEGNTVFLRSRASFGRVESASLPELKHYLRDRGIDCRNGQCVTNK